MGTPRRETPDWDDDIILAGPGRWSPAAAGAVGVAETQDMTRDMAGNVRDIGRESGKKGRKEKGKRKKNKQKKKKTRSPTGAGITKSQTTKGEKKRRRRRLKTLVEEMGMDKSVKK